MEAIDLARIGETISKAKDIAKEYRNLTGKPLGITGEVAEYEAARLLGLELCAARQEGYDAVCTSDGTRRQIQIKGRCIRGKAKGKVPSIRFDHEWSTVMLVLLNDDFEPLFIYEAERNAVENALLKPGSTSRNIRGQLSITKFKSISKMVWCREDGMIAAREI